MGEQVSLGNGQTGYCWDPEEVDTDNSEEVLPESLFEHITRELEDYGITRGDAEGLTGRMVQLIGPAAGRYLVLTLMKRNGPLFLGLPTPFLRKVYDEQDSRLAKQLF